MLSKWKIDLPGMDLYRFGEDKNLYRLPYEGAKYFSLRKLKKHRGCWVIKGIRWSEHQLRPHIIIDDSPILLMKSDSLPF